MKRLYNGQDLENKGTTLSISAYGDTIKELRINLYNEAKKFFGFDYEVLIPDELDIVITLHSTYFASAYVKGIRRDYETIMVFGQY
jgi:hypothetical protein